MQEMSDNTANGRFFSAASAVLSFRGFDESANPFFQKGAALLSWRTTEGSEAIPWSGCDASGSLRHFVTRDDKSCNVALTLLINNPGQGSSTKSSISKSFSVFKSTI